MRVFNVKKIELLLKKIFSNEKSALKRRSLRFYKKPVELEIRILKKLTSNKLGSIDIGVYRGVYTYHLNKLSSHVYAFEANALLQDNLNKAFKNIKSITLENLAVSSSSGKSNLKIPYRNKNISYENLEEKYELGLATIHNKNDLENKNYYEIEISRIKLDEYQFKHPIGFIKIDVEGHELEIIKGAEKLINLYRPNLLLEIEQRHTGLAPIKIINQIKEKGYCCYIVKDKSLTFIKIDEENIDIYDNNNYIFIPISN